MRKPQGEDVGVGLAVLMLLVYLAFPALLVVESQAAPLLEGPVDLGNGCTGTFLVGRGIARMYYYGSANDGANREAYDNGYCQGRAAMDSADGDWLRCGITIPDGCHWAAGPGTRIILTLSDGTEVASTTIIVTDDASGKRERRAWSTSHWYLWFNATAPYLRHANNPGEFCFYVRFPDRSILDDRGADDTFRPFKVCPVAVRVENTSEGR
jgi:hypothetical protein